MTTPPQITQAWLSAVLAGLGESADQVAATLRTAKIKGVRRSPTSCPVARYVKAKAYEHTPTTHVIVNVGAHVYVDPASPDDNQPHLEVAIPEPVTAFIGDFDDGLPAYADLVDDPQPPTPQSPTQQPPTPERPTPR